MKDDTRVLRFGIAGTIVLTVCCFTPLPVILLGALGLGAWTVYLDRVLLPLLMLSLGVTAVGLWRVKRGRGE